MRCRKGSSATDQGGIPTQSPYSLSRRDFHPGEKKWFTFWNQIGTFVYPITILISVKAKFPNQDSSFSKDFFYCRNETFKRGGKKNQSSPLVKSHLASFRFSGKNILPPEPRTIGALTSCHVFICENKSLCYSCVIFLVRKQLFRKINN